MSAYESVNKSRLKLKTDSCVKKKRKSKDKEKILEKIAKVDKHADPQSGDFKKCDSVPLTKAERAFLKMKEEKQMKQIMEKANKTHKQRVEEFNRHLDSLTEHYDIPKVSWTK